MEKKPIKQNLKQPCNACPFRKNSLGGYLGGVWTAPDLHKYVMAEQVFACHKTIDENNQPLPELEHCAGSVIYMNKNAKRCREPFLAKAQDKLRGNDMSNILSVPEFMEHHKTAKKTDEPYNTEPKKSSSMKKVIVRGKRTQKEIDEEINKLERYKKVVPPETAFGDNNRKVVEYQIAVLRGEYLDASDIDEITEFEDEQKDEDDENEDLFDVKELNQSEASSVLEAFSFLNGDNDEIVSEDDIKVFSKKK